MPGERYSQSYARSEAASPDSARARYRIGALFRESLFNHEAERLADYLSRQLGVPVPGNGKRASDWLEFLRDCRTSDFLDTISLVYRYLFWQVGEESARWWKDVVRQIFAEETLAYVIDDVGGVHPAIDQEFQKNIASVIATLQSDRYQGIRRLLEIALGHLSADPPNYKQAWAATMSGVEGLFGLMFPQARMTADDLERRIQPVVKRAYEGDAAAQKAAQNLLVSFREWIEASQNYRHQPGGVPVQPPADIAILAISFGASLLRWLAGLNESRPLDTSQ
jgi:hypothetical protein